MEVIFKWKMSKIYKDRKKTRSKSLGCAEVATII